MKRKRENDETENDEIKKRKISDNLSFEEKRRENENYKSLTSCTNEEILKKLSEGIEKHNDNAVLYYFMRGMQYEQMEKNDLAIYDYTNAMKLDPKNPLYYTMRGFVYSSIKQYDLALQDLSKAIKLKPKFSFALNERGRIYEKLKLFDLAYQDFSEVIKMKESEKYLTLSHLYYIIKITIIYCRLNIWLLQKNLRMRIC